MKLHLTDLAIRKLASPTNGQVTYWDQTTPGFGLRCSTKSKSFVVMYGHKRRLKTIGRYPRVSLADARREAKRFLATALDAPLLAEGAVVMFSDAKDEFLKECATRNKPRTVSDYTRLLNRHFPLKADLTSITRQKIMKIVSALSSTPSEQAHAYVAIRTMMNWCVRQGYIEQSPVPPMTFKSNSRKRILTEEELKIVVQQAKEFPYPFGPIVLLMLLTGQRRGEVAAIRRSWITDDTLVFPQGFTKNRQEHTLPLPSSAITLIESLPHTGDLLFPSRHDNERPFNGWGKCKRRFDEPLGLAPYTLHDLRRTFSSNLAMLGVPIHVTEKILNHISGTVTGVAAVYNRYSYFDETKDALERYDAYLSSLFGDTAL